jgi:hypothetical protein
MSDVRQGLRRNKDDCVALAERATRILLDVQDQMAGRWDDAPDTLLRGLSKLEGCARRSLIVSYVLMVPHSSTEPCAICRSIWRPSRQHVGRTDSWASAASRRI